MRKGESNQLLFVFADNPSGGKGEVPIGEPAGKSTLRQIAKARKVKDSPTTPSGSLETLMEKVASLPNLAAALLAVARNQGAPGVDGLTVEEVLSTGHLQIATLSKDLQNGQYRPGDIRRVEIPKPGGGSRNLGIPNVLDRWVQQAVLQILSPIYEPKFHNSSHGFRPNRGAATAIAEAKGHLTEGCNWVVSIDLSKFFDRVNHQRLLARLAQTIPDKRVLNLVHLMLKANVALPDGSRITTKEGTPQGGPLSPLLSNIVLDELDWELQRRKLRFVRYADDFNVYVRSRRAGERVMASLSAYIEKRLRLKINADKSEVSPPEDVHLLGFSLVKGKDDQIEVRLSRRSQERINAKIRELTPRNWGWGLRSCLERANRYLKGWIGYFRLCTREEEETLRAIDRHIRRRIRAIIVKQHRTNRSLYRHLRKRKVGESTARKTAFASCGPWRKSNLGGLTSAYRNVWFANRLTNLQSEWNRLNPTKVVQVQLELDF